MAFDLYPSVDEGYNFPQPVRQAISSSSEIKASISTEITKSVTPIVRDVASDYIASNQAVIDAAISAIDATPAMTELANRPKSTAPSLAPGTDLNTMYKKEHVGWYGFSRDKVVNEPEGMGTAMAMLEVIAPESSAAVQRVHDRNSRTTFERSMITTTIGWSAWRRFVMADEAFIRRGVLENYDFNNLAAKEDIGVWTAWAPFNQNLPLEATNRVTVEILIDSNSSVVQRVTERETGDVWTRTKTSTSLTGWTPWLRLTNSDLSTFRRACIESSNQSTSMLVVSDSNGEGHGLTDISRRWVNTLQKLLNSNYGNKPGAEFPYIPARYIVSTPGGGSELSGDVSTLGIGSASGTGFGWRGALLNGPDSVATFTFVGTSFSLLYNKGYLGGVMSVRIDDETPILVNTYSETYVSTARHDSGPLSKKKHTVTVTRHTSSGVETKIFLQGLMTWNEDEDKGIRVIDGSRSGLRMAHVDRDAFNHISAAIKSIGGVDLVVVNLGTNDERNGVSLETYKTNAQAIVDNLYKEYSYQGDLLFMIPWLGADNNYERMLSFATALGEIARKTPKVSFYNLGSDFPDIPTPTTAVSGLGYFGDGLHVNDVGTKAVAGRVYNRIIDK